MTNQIGNPDEVDARIELTPDWQQAILRQARRLIKQAEPDILEEVKWRKPTNPAGVVVWSHDGQVCTGETYKDKVKITFARGASLDDPEELFNASLGAGTRRAIDLKEGQALIESAFVELIRAAVAFNAL